MTTIERIRAEIQTKYYDIPWQDSDYDCGWIEALEWVLIEILDKYAEQEPTEERQNRDFDIECQNHNAMLHKAQENVIEKFKSCADMLSDEELKGANLVMEWVYIAQPVNPHEPKSPCDLCKYNPPSSCDGKPCTMCPAEKGGE